MIELKGKYNYAIVFTDDLEIQAEKQITNLLNHEFIKDSKIRIMPDVHAGIGCTIGTTMTIQDKIVPNLVGVDIGCGTETVLLKNKNIELEKLDKIIHNSIPSGFEIRKTVHPYIDELALENLRCLNHINIKRARLSLGTLGGGNHFIEINEDENGQLYLVVHSGSRHLGKQVAEYYQNLAFKDLKKKNIRINKNLAYLEGKLFDDYLHDMALVQKYAEKNRHAIVSEIVKQMKFKVIDSFTTIHNYIDIESMILRKGAVSAKKGERLLIPINMRDGSLLCIGKGNEEWNYSAPHGAGRILSRRAAKESFKMSDFKKSMEDIYSTTINKGTLDEAPFAYKPIDEIIANIGDTVEIVGVLKPLYNFKAVE
ncbi:MAG: RtcB family protein [Miniphocaeibacter sp.]|uniref:RtcB family protein n=1 Tax=Miniphocaeibacter sp. TaxID=3100973 RepID=UPI0017CD20FB|nr:RtcB family protein [Gallicola sp.]